MRSHPMHPPVAVVGTGSIGLFLAARLSKHTSVSWIGRKTQISNPHADLTLIEAGGEHNYSNLTHLNWSQQNRFVKGTLVFLTPKVFQLPEVLKSVAERVDASHTLVLCQNGLSVLEEAQEAIPGANWIRALFWFGVKIESPFRARVSGQPRVEMAGVRTESVANLKVLLEKAQVDVSVLEGKHSMALVEWRKALWNVAFNGVCALAGVPNGRGLDDPGLRALGEKLLDEALEVARAEGVPLTVEDRERVFISARNAAANVNSTLQDLRAGRRTEMAWLNGAIVKKAERLGVSVPTNRAISQLVGFLEQHPESRI